jgi:hypothetical protein
VNSPLRVAPAEGVIATQLSGEYVLLHLETGHYYGLDGVGSRVWDMLASGMEIPAICAQVESEFDAPADVIRNDISSLIEALLKAKLAVAL